MIQQKDIFQSKEAAANSRYSSRHFTDCKQPQKPKPRTKKTIQRCNRQEIQKDSATRVIYAQVNSQVSQTRTGGQTGKETDNGEQLEIMPQTTSSIQLWKHDTALDKTPQVQHQTEWERQTAIYLLVLLEIDRISLSSIPRVANS
jgi:hypothetical protein